MSGIVDRLTTTEDVLNALRRKELTNLTKNVKISIFNFIINLDDESVSLTDASGNSKNTNIRYKATEGVNTRKVKLIFERNGNDSSGNDNHFTVVGSPTFTYEVDKRRFKMSLDGSINQYAVLNPATVPTRTITVCMRFKTSDTTKDGTPFSYCPNPFVDNHFMLHNYRAPVLYVKTLSVTLSSITGLNNGAEHTAIVSWDAATGTYTVWKDGGVQKQTGTIAATGTTTVWTNSGGTFNTLDNSIKRLAMKITDAIYQDQILQTARFYLKKTGTPTGTLTCTLRRVSDDSIIATATTTLDVSTLTTSSVAKDFTFPAGTITPKENFRISIEYANGTASNNVNAERWDANVWNGGNYSQYSGTSWSDVGTRELRGQMTLQGLTSGGAFVIGQEQDSLGGGFAANQAFLGDVYLCDVYERVFNDTDALNWHNTGSITSNPAKASFSEACTGP